MGDFSAILQPDWFTPTCLGHLGWCDTNRLIYICVTLPKMEKADMGGVITALEYGRFCQKALQMWILLKAVFTLVQLFQKYTWQQHCLYLPWPPCVTWYTNRTVIISVTLSKVEKTRIGKIIAALNVDVFAKNLCQSKYYLSAIFFQKCPFEPLWLYSRYLPWPPYVTWHKQNHSICVTLHEAEKVSGGKLNAALKCGFFCQNILPMWIWIKSSIYIHAVFFQNGH